MKNNNLSIHFDAEADILELQIGEPTESYFEEIDDDLFEGRDEKTGELKGYKIFNFRKRGNINGIKSINIPLPVNISLNASNS